MTKLFLLTSPVAGVLKYGYLSTYVNVASQGHQWGTAMKTFQFSRKKIGQAGSEAVVVICRTITLHYPVAGLSYPVAGFILPSCGVYLTQLRGVFYPVAGPIKDPGGVSHVKKGMASRALGV